MAKRNKNKNTNNTNNTNNTTSRNVRRRQRRNAQRLVVSEEEVLLQRMANLMRAGANKVGRGSRGDIPLRYARAPAPNSNDLGAAVEFEAGNLARRLARPARGRLAGAFTPDKLGHTLEGGLWCFKYFHPCSEFVSDVPRGIPDSTTTSVVTFEHRCQTSVTGPSTTAAWGMVILNTPFVEAPVMWRVFQETATLGSANHIWGQYQDIRSAGWGVLSPAGTMGYCLYQPNPLQIPAQVAGLNFATSGRDYSQWRTMYKGVTITMDSNYNNNQGWGTAANIGFGARKEVAAPLLQAYYGDGSSVMDWIEGEANTSPQVVQDNIEFQVPPQITENVVMNQGVGVEGKPAREGFYFQSKFREPFTALPFRAVADAFPDQPNATTTDLPPPEGFLLITTYAITVSGVSVDGTFVVRSSTNNASDLQQSTLFYQGSNSAMVLSEPSYVQPTVTILRNLSPQASINLKSIEGIEAQLNLTRSSVGARHAHGSPCSDDFALRLATEVSQRISGVYDARDNSAGEVIGKIAGVVADVSAFLQTFLPGPYGAAAGAVSGVAKAIRAFL